MSSDFYTHILVFTFESVGVVGDVWRIVAV